MKITSTPEIDDPLIIEFVRRLCDDVVVRMRRAVTVPTYVDNHQLTLVEHCPGQNAVPAQCWFNCLAEEALSHGQTIYGWTIWKDEGPTGEVSYWAQHHAVLRANGKLVDITPYLNAAGKLTKAEAILFVPDQRVPFDEEKKSFPATLVWHPHQNKWYWAKRGEANNSWIPLAGYGVLTPEL